MKSKYLEMPLRSSPHIWRGVGVDTIMRNVVFALLPIVAMAVYAFGLSAILLIAATTAACVCTEALICRGQGRECSLGDYSAVITGILLGLVLPPGFPLWMAVTGSVVSMLLGKLIFGGLGFNPFNPALVGRAFLQAAFPVAMTTWSEPFAPGRFLRPIASTLTFPFMEPAAGAVTGATPLSAFKFQHDLTGIYDLFIGDISGSAGETSALIILLCGCYLALRRMLDWRIPVGILLTVAVFSAVLHAVDAAYPPPLFMLFSGGLVLGAVFMATDMVTSPITPGATWIYSIVIGVLVVVIRIFGGLPEGVMYAILFGNALAPLLNQATQPRIYGAKGKA